MSDLRISIRLPFEAAKPALPLATPTTSPQASISISVSEDEIRPHAYQLYQRRLSEHCRSFEDRSVEDWLTAEAHLKARKNRANKTNVR